MHLDHSTIRPTDYDILNLHYLDNHIVNLLVPAARHPELVTPDGHGDDPTCSHADTGPLVSEYGVVLSESADSNITIDSEEDEHRPHVIPIDCKEVS